MNRLTAIFAALAGLGTLSCAKEPPAASAPAAQAQAQPPSSTEPAAQTTTDKDPSIMTIFDAPIAKLGSDDQVSLAEHKGKALLIVNVASKCGLTPQYEGLEALHAKYAGKGFAVLGFPCNQFGGQEPGSAEEIQAFCTSNYGVSFPMYEKIEVNGPGRHPVYQALTQVADGSGAAGDVKWNFEKFVVSADGSTVTRFRPQTAPDDPALIDAIEAALPQVAD